MYKKYKREPQLKIGSKTENILYSEKNIHPDLNLFNKQLSAEEYKKNMTKKYQKEEFSTLSKNFQDNYMGPPNLAHQRIDFDNVSGKIGQENREIEIEKYQKQPPFAKDQIYNTYRNNDKENNKKYYHNIINNTIFGFCDPSMKYPKTSYQSNFKGNDINEQLKTLSQRQYEDYMQFRKEQIELMNKGNLGRNLRELPPRQKKVNYDEIQNFKNEKEFRDRKYKEDMEYLIKQQKLLDQNQARTFNPNSYAPSMEEYELQLQQQKINALNQLNQLDNINKNMNDNKNNNDMGPIKSPPHPKIENREINKEEINKYDNSYNNNNYKDIYNEKQIPSYDYPREQIDINPKEQEMIQQKEEYNNGNYGNEIPQNYEEYQRLLEKDKMRRESEELKKIENNENNLYNRPMYNQQINENKNDRERKGIEAEDEYLQNVKKYEEIIQDNPEQKFKLPPPPFGYNNIPSLNKMSMDSQLQGPTPGNINKNTIVSQNPYSINNYSLGESNLEQNPIIHPVNSYQFDYNRLYNPLIDKNK